MPKCPKCGVEVDHLVNQVAEIHFYNLRVENNRPTYEEQDWAPIGLGDYHCPECQDVLFKREDEALAFLKG